MITKYVIRAASREDMAAVANMIRELAVYHKMPEVIKMTAKDLENDGFNECHPPAFKCKVAELDRALVGYAIYVPSYSTWAGRLMVLDDLYVQQKHRKKGIGEKLFDAVAKEAASTRCSRLEFHVVEWNKAIAFYEAKGAVNLTKKAKWCYFQLSGEALTRFAEEITCIPKK